MRLPLLTSLLAIMPLAAQAQTQSALRPGSAASAEIADLGNLMFIGAALIFALVLAAAVMALFGPAALRAAIRRHGFIVAGGIAFPFIVLSALLAYSLLSSSSLVRAGQPADLRIEVRGELWWWRVRYLDAAGATVFETANELRIPAGRPVDVLLTSSDVIHSFWVPELGGKTDMIPGHVNRQRLQADAPGVFRGQCAEYCGSQHAHMAFHVVALAPAEFDAWQAAQMRPAQAPAAALPLRGQAVFVASDCAECHTIRGTPAGGTKGPDLTHVGSRLSLAAGMLPNNIGAFGGWIAASQHIKPGNKMPAADRLSGPDLRALAAYMESLQ